MLFADCFKLGLIFSSWEQQLGKYHNAILVARNGNVNVVRKNDKIATCGESEAGIEWVTGDINS